MQLKSGTASSVSFSGSHWSRLIAAAALCGLSGCSDGDDNGKQHTASTTAAETENPPNVVLVTVDTLRADHLNCYGYDVPTSPSIDQLAEEGVMFANAVAASPWTLPSMATIHTSLYPSQHGAVSETTGLRPAVTTLAEVLKAKGYTTKAIVSHRFVSKRYAFDQGFDFFDETEIGAAGRITSHRVTRMALDELETDLNEPFFLWTHYFDPHTTYVPHEEFEFSDRPKLARPAEELGAVDVGDLLETSKDLRQRDLDYIVATYDEEIAYTDKQIGKLMDGVGELDLEHPMVALLTADHGEFFMERGRFGHGNDLHRELVHVPLIFSGEINRDLKGQVINRFVETASIPKTVAELAGVENSRFRGENLLEKTGQSDSPALFLEGGSAFRKGRPSVAIIDDGWKLILHENTGHEELYHLENDPLERRNLAEADEPEIANVAARMRKALETFCQMPAPQATEHHELTAEEIEALRALGYTPN